MPDNQIDLSIKDRINLALERSGKSQRELARLMDKSSAAVSEMLTKPGDIESIAYIEATEKLTGYRFEWLRTGKGPEKGGELADHSIEIPNSEEKRLKASGSFSQPVVMEEASITYLSGKTIRPVTVTIDRSGKELISYVPVKAQAGYRRGFGDPKYLEKLPAFNLPMNIAGAGTFRMFQVDGNSMRQLGGGGLNDGDIVISSYVEDIINDVRDGRVYVLVTTEGVLVKRVINRLKTDDKVLVANSDNKSGEYPPIILHPNEILEVWELRAYISKQLSFSTDLWDVINDLQVQQALLKDEVQGLKQGRQLPG